VLLLDEPTNDLDTQTLTVLEDYLETFPGVVITVSHDRYFLDKVAEQLLIFQGNGKVEKYFGEYSDYLEEQLKKKAENAESKPVAAKEQAQKAKPAKRRLSYKEQKEWEEIEDKIAALEAKLQEITLEMEQSASDYEKVQALASEHEQLSAELDALLERWAELSELVESLQS
jgi:ATP-binding cassette subfamily F protein uup